MKSALLGVLLGFILIICTSQIHGEGKHHGKHGPEQNKTCDLTFNKTNGTISVLPHSPTVMADEHCTWHIAYNASDNTTKPEEHKIFLVFDQMNLAEGDQITVTSDGKGLPLFDPFEYKPNDVGVISFLTGRSNITVTLNTGHSEMIRKFQMQYYSNSECNHTFSGLISGVFRSPLYDSSNYIMPISCWFIFQWSDKRNTKLNFWFEKNGFNEGNISVSGSDKRDATFTAENFTTDEFLSTNILNISMEIKNTSANPEQFLTKYDVVHDVCSGTYQLKTSMPTILDFPKLNEIQSIMARTVNNLNCLWLVESEPGHTINVNLKNVSLPSVYDEFLILDGPNRSSPLLKHLQSDDQQQDRVIYSTGSKLWIYASTPFLTANFNIQVEVFQTEAGGHFHGSGPVEVSDTDTVFLLEVPADQNVKLVLDNKATHLATGSLVSFYSDFLNSSEPFTQLLPSYALDVVISPTNQLAVVTQSFKTSKLSGSFLGIQKGCYELALGTGGTYYITGHCNETCSWIVRPDPKELSAGDLLNFRFPILNLSKNDTVSIHKGIDANQTLVANLTANLTSFPDLWLPAVNGATIHVTRLNCNNSDTVIKASYLVVPECQATLSPHPSEFVTISSPGYPNHYPLGVSCAWTVVKPNGSVFLHVNLKDIQLATKLHTLKLFSVLNETKTLLLEFSGENQKLPDDLPVPTNLYVEFSTEVESQFKTMPGFQMQVAAVEKGGLMTGSNGTFSTPDYPKAVTNGSLFAWIVNVTSTDQQKEIIEFSLNNQTTEINKTLKIYDGSSLRSQLLENYTGSELSKYNTLLFLYQRDPNTPGPAFSISYHNFSCNMSMMCENGICMHEDWHCNDNNDCGDFSDERNCEGGLAPTPPPPTPEPSHEVKGVSTAILLSSIFTCLVVGIVLGFAVPIGYQRYRARQFTTYTSLNT